MTNKGFWTRGDTIWHLGFLHTYPLTMFSGVLISFLSVAYFWHRMKYSWEILQVMVILIVPGSIVGARLWFLIAAGADANWSEWYKFDGLSIQGGVTGAILCTAPYIWSKRYAIDFRTTLGIVLPSVLIGQAIGRWGNFANHEVYGKIVSEDSLNWLTFIKSHMYISGTENLADAAYRAPLFFYESILNLIGYLLIFWTIQRKNWFKPGVPAAFYLMWYGITRLVMEPLRDPSDILQIGNVQISSLIAALWLVGGIILFVWFQGLTRPFDKWVLAILPEKFLGKFQKEYKAIKPIKPRKIMFFGQKVEYKKSILMFWGKRVDNKVKLWIPEEETRWSKREINKGTKKKKGI